MIFLARAQMDPTGGVEAGLPVCSKRSDHHFFAVAGLTTGMQRSATAPPSNYPQRCDYCGYVVSAAPITDAAGAVFCSGRCRDAYGDGDEPFVGRFGFRQYTTGVGALDSLLPNGIPANSFVLLAGRDGIRHRSLQTELVWRALQRGEPAILISFVDPPVAVVEHFLTFGWNVLPYLEAGAFHIVDCFTNRLRERHRTPDQQVAWNDFITGFLDETVTTIKDTTNLRSVESALHNRLKAQGMVGTGLVVVDSLNEIETQVNELQTEQFLKEIRGDVCNRNFVPIFASTTITDDEKFTAEHAYLFDGIVDMFYDSSIVPGARLKQLGIRKLDGCRYRPYWVSYEVLEGLGLHAFDPRTEFQSIYGMPDSGTAGNAGSGHALPN